MKIFCYGSLLSSLHNHSVLLKHKAKFVGCGQTLLKYALTARGDGAYPYMTSFKLNEFQVLTKIKGEVYEVNHECLAALDILEGHPDYYARSKIEVAVAHCDQQNVRHFRMASRTLSDAFSIQCCDAYFLTNKYTIAKIKQLFDKEYFDVESGDWKEYRSRVLVQPVIKMSESGRC